MITAEPINPARLDRRITLLSLTKTRDAIGAAVASWETDSSVWARWLPQNSREFMAAQARFSTLSALLRIRYRSDIRATWRAVVNGVQYKLMGDPIEVGRREYLDLPMESILGDFNADFSSDFQK